MGRSQSQVGILAHTYRENVNFTQKGSGYSTVVLNYVNVFVILNILNMHHDNQVGLEYIVSQLSFEKEMPDLTHR